jgi:hypothetical protein
MLFLVVSNHRKDRFLFGILFKMTYKIFVVRPFRCTFAAKNHL